MAALGPYGPKSITEAGKIPHIVRARRLYCPGLARRAPVGRVLLIDDHPLFRSALRVVVRKVQANLTVVEAETFGRAREIAVSKVDLPAFG